MKASRVVRRRSVFSVSCLHEAEFWAASWEVWILCLAACKARIYLFGVLRWNILSLSSAETLWRESRSVFPGGGEEGERRLRIETEKFNPLCNQEAAASVKPNLRAPCLERIWQLEAVWKVKFSDERNVWNDRAELLLWKRRLWLNVYEEKKKKKWSEQKFHQQVH